MRIFSLHKGKGAKREGFWQLRLIYIKHTIICTGISLKTHLRIKLASSSKVAKQILKSGIADFTGSKALEQVSFEAIHIDQGIITVLSPYSMSS